MSSLILISLCWYACVCVCVCFISLYHAFMIKRWHILKEFPSESPVGWAVEGNSSNIYQSFMIHKSSNSCFIYTHKGKWTDIPLPRQLPFSPPWLMINCNEDFVYLPGYTLRSFGVTVDVDVWHQCSRNMFCLFVGGPQCGDPRLRIHILQTQHMLRLSKPVVPGSRGETILYRYTHIKKCI